MAIKNIAFSKKVIPEVIKLLLECFVLVDRLLIDFVDCPGMTARGASAPDTFRLISERCVHFDDCDISGMAFGTLALTHGLMRSK